MSQPYFRDAHGNVYDERGFLLPFLAGVLVTAPFAFLKGSNSQQQYQYIPPPPAPAYYPVYPQYPYPQYPYSQYPYR